MQNHPLVIAHRGARKYVPENTIPAMEQSALLKADGVEFDVQMTRDGALVVCHNYLVDKTSNGHGRIADMTFQELRELDFGDGVKIPTVDEVLLAARNMRVINMETKRPPVAVRREMVGKCVDAIRKFHLEKKIIVSSFDYPVIDEVKRIAPDIPCGLLYSVHHSGEKGMSRGRYIRQAVSHKAEYLHPTYNYALSPIYRLRCRLHHIGINCWGITGDKEMRILTKLPVNAVITDCLVY